MTFSNREEGIGFWEGSVPLFTASFGMPPRSSTRSSRRRALSLVICPSKATVYRFPSLSNSSTRIFFAGKRSTPKRDVHKLLTSHLKAVLVNRSRVERCRTVGILGNSGKLLRVWDYRLYRFRHLRKDFGALVFGVFQ